MVRRRELGNFKSANAGTPGISRGPGATQPLQESPERWPPGRPSRGHRARLGAEVQEPERGPEMGWIPAEKDLPLQTRVERPSAKLPE